MRKVPTLPLVVAVAGWAVAASAQTAPQPFPFDPLASGGSIQIPVATPQNAGPKIEFDEPQYDFGTIQSGDKVSHTFRFKNTGSQTLEIKDVKTSCGCTTAGDWPRTLEPGQSGAIPIQFNSGRFKGTISKSVMITSNDPQKPTTVLYLKGKIWVPIEIEPSYATFSSIQDTSASKSTVVRIRNHTEEPLALSGLTLSGDKFQAELKTLKEGEEYALHVTTVPPLEYGANRATIALKTSSQKMPTLTIPVTAYVLQPVQVVPSRITLPTQSNNKLTKYVTVLCRDGSDLEIKEAKINIESVTLEVSEIAPKKQYRILLTFPPETEFPEHTAAKLSLKTNHPEFSELEVPISQYNTVRRLTRPPSR